jgi:hypothetical protein
MGQCAGDLSAPGIHQKAIRRPLLAPIVNLNEQQIAHAVRTRRACPRQSLSLDATTTETLFVKVICWLALFLPPDIIGIPGGQLADVEEFMAGMTDAEEG